MTVPNWWSGITLDLPNSGAAAQLYYRQFSSAIAAETTIQLLRPGATVFDVGAHVGEYTTIAAKCVGPGGVVHAFEPQPDLQSILHRNMHNNSLANVSVYQCAVTDRSGTVGLVIDRKSMGGWINPNTPAVEQVPEARHSWKRVGRPHRGAAVSGKIQNSHYL
jgi:predicted RNA methylase